MLRWKIRYWPRWPLYSYIAYCKQSKGYWEIHNDLNKNIIKVVHIKKLAYIIYASLYISYFKFLTKYKIFKKLSFENICKYLFKVGT